MNVERRTADNRPFIMPLRRKEKETRRRKFCFPDRAKQLESQPQPDRRRAHIARKRFINQMRRLITFHHKQAKDAFVS